MPLLIRAAAAKSKTCHFGTPTPAAVHYPNLEQRGWEVLTTAHSGPRTKCCALPGKWYLLLGWSKRRAGCATSLRRSR